MNIQTRIVSGSAALQASLVNQDSEHACRTEPDLRRYAGRGRNRLRLVRRRLYLHFVSRMAVGLLP